jgi:tetratricopeptide (TPR) repeat protein
MLNAAELLQSATTHHQAGRMAEAEKAYREVLVMEKANPLALRLLGGLYLQTGRAAQAVEYLEKAARVSPQDAETHTNLGSALRGIGRMDDALTRYRHALTINPNYAEAHYNMGNVLKIQEKYDEAVYAYQRAVAIRPNYIEAHHNLGNIFLLQSRFEDAVQSHQRVVALKPDYAEAYVSLGKALAFLEEDKGALDNFQRALNLRPEHADAHSNRAIINLRLGNFAAGWPEYEWRWRSETMAGIPSPDIPLWDGKGLQGKTILLYCEQGYGDSLQFIRYAPMVKEKGGQVFLSCPQPLLRLFERVDGIDRIFPEETGPPACDRRAPLLSLPLLFDTRLDNIPASVPYLSVPPDLVALWAERMRPYNGLKVGVVWAGNPRAGNAHHNAIDRRRSMSLEQFAPLGKVSSNIHFFSLQKGSPADQTKRPLLGLELINFMDSVEDFADTAALIANLDLVIGVDTSVIHLAGAMGKPVWVLSRFAGCWRWLLNREDSPWYPTLRLFRQPHAGDWSSVVENVCAALGQLASDSR